MLTITLPVSILTVANTKTMTLSESLIEKIDEAKKFDEAEEIEEAREIDKVKVINKAGEMN